MSTKSFIYFSFQNQVPGIQVQQVEVKWRKLKAQFRTYEDNKSSSDMGRMTEPQHYELLSSILKHRPLSRSTLCELEGTSDKQELLPAIEQYPGDPASPNPPTPQPAPTRIKLEKRLLPPALLRKSPMKTWKRRIRPETEKREIIDVLKSFDASIKRKVEETAK